MEVTRGFLDNVTKAEMKYWPLKTYHPESQEQHPLFPLNELPMYTFLEDTETSFVYVSCINTKKYRILYILLT